MRSPETQKFNGTDGHFDLGIPTSVPLQSGTSVPLQSGTSVPLQSGKSIGSGTLEMSLAAISYYFVTAGHVSPTDSALCKYLIRASGRLLSATKSICEPITAPELKRVLEHHLVDKCSLKIRMHLTVLLFMFLGLLRYDDAACILVNADLLQFITKHNSTILDGVLIFLPRSKTDQGWHGAG